MATYIFTETEPFSAIAESRSTYADQAAMVYDVRRPVRGLQVSKDTHAYLRVITESNRPLDLISSGAYREDERGVGKTSTYANFLLQRATIARAELKQFVKTFGLTYLFLFGENPIVINIDGALIHSVDFPWDEEWWVNYENTLRASRTAELGARVYLYYDRVMIEGYILNATTNREAEARHLVPLAFTLAATNIKFLPKVGATQFPVYATMFDFPKPGGDVGRGLNSALPFGTSLGFTNMSAFASLSTGTEGIAMAGSFQQLVRTVVDNPWILAGVVKRSAYSLVGEGVGALSGRRLPRPRKPRYGKIRENRDEYVGEAPMRQEYAPRGPVQEFHEYVDQEREGELSGDAMRSQLQEGPALSGTDPFEGLGTGPSLRRPPAFGADVVENDLVPEAGGSEDTPPGPQSDTPRYPWNPPGPPYNSASEGRGGPSLWSGY